jgi:hypothetical protein
MGHGPILWIPPFIEITRTATVSEIINQQGFYGLVDPFFFATAV